jgi:7-cyano-7-deazaguanine synthase
MSLVNLVSGGLDSTLVGVLTAQQDVKQFPLFVDYGQRARRREWDACRRVHKHLKLPAPRKVDLTGYGKLIRSGLTEPSLRVVTDAFTPGRNMLFILIGASYAVQVKAKAVSIGLLDEKYALFPDQTYDFVTAAERTVQIALGVPIRITAPLMNFSKRDVIALAASKGIRGTYSCHAGTSTPCGRCISCKEFRL